MKTEEFVIPSKVDDLPLSVLTVLPDTPPIGAIQWVHGMCEHKKRYLPIMKFLADHGFASIIADIRGHGKSILAPEDLGYFYEAGANGAIADTALLSTYIQKEFPKIPLYLFGHSMGCLLVQIYLQKFGVNLAGVMLCGSPTTDLPMINQLTLLPKSICKIKGDRYRSSLMQKLVIGKFNKAFESENTLNAWLSSDPAVVAAYNEDPLCNYTFTLNGFIALFSMISKVHHNSKTSQINETLPVWFIAGEKDPCVGSPEKFEEAIDHFKKLGYLAVSHRIYPNMRHEILNEIEKETVFSDILEKLKGWNELATAYAFIK